MLVRVVTSSWQFPDSEAPMVRGEKTWEQPSPDLLLNVLELQARKLAVESEYRLQSW